MKVRVYKLAVSLLIALTACGGGGSPQVQQVQSDDPFNIAKAAYEAASAGNYDKARGYFTAEGLETLFSDLAREVNAGNEVEMWQGFAEADDGGITGVELEEDPQIEGDGATLEILVRDKGGVRHDRLTLIKRGGSWKIIDINTHT